MKKLQNLVGAKTLSKKEQKAVKGGMVDYCSGGDIYYNGKCYPPKVLNELN